MDLSGITPLSTAPYPYTELQEKCLRDLETTEEAQGSGLLEKRLDNGKSSFCCLGRFCIVAELPRVSSHDHCYSFGLNGESVSHLPEALQSQLRLGEMGDFKRPLEFRGHYESLAGMNDSGHFTFKEIAAYIRHDPWNVFKNEPLIEATQAVAIEAAA